MKILAGNAGAGRPRGSLNKRTSALIGLVEAGESPAAFGLRIMRDETQPLDVRLNAARLIAPYVHSRPSPAGETVNHLRFVWLNISSLAGIGDDVRFYQMSAPVQPGNSGGPLLDLAGNVVGIVTARIDDFVVAGATGSLPQNVNFSIKASIAASFMDTHGIRYKSDHGGNPGDLASVVDAAKKFTVLIECTR